MKKNQWATVAISIVLLIVLLFFGRTVPHKKPSNLNSAKEQTAVNPISTDSILIQAKKQLTADQVARLNAIEYSVKRGDVKNQQLNAFHQLARFWSDTARIFEPYAWYVAEAARLENSEKSLNFAGHLFLENLRAENNPALKTWKDLQAKDLFERSLKINPKNDSSIIGLGACYIFGNISLTPMKGIMKVRSVVEKDSTNIFGQEVLGQASMLSGQYEKVISRFETVYRLAKNNPAVQIQASLMLAEAYERKNDKTSAIEWYKKSLLVIKNEEIKSEVEKRIEELKK